MVRALPVSASPFANGLAMARILSMKYSARGLSARFFNVMSAIGRWLFGMATGKDLIIGDVPGTASAKPWMTVRKPPVVSSLLRMISDGVRAVGGGSWNQFAR